jgi:hypothetical protein
MLLLPLLALSERASRVQVVPTASAHQASRVPPVVVAKYAVAPATVTSDEVRSDSTGLTLRLAAVVSADLNEDGVSDLVSGSVANGAGLIQVRPGSERIGRIVSESDSTSSGPAVDAFFSDSVSTMTVSFEFDRLLSGDFDADGHLDIVAGLLGDSRLHLLRGDGKGGLHFGRTIELPGSITALNAGETNRPDGLSDICVAITDSTGAQLKVFEGPSGALNSTPETHQLPTQARAIELGRLDDDNMFEIVVGAGSDVLILSGRDRKLSHMSETRSRVPGAQRESVQLAADVVALAMGDFEGDRAAEIAALLSDGSVSLVHQNSESGASGDEIRTKRLVSETIFEQSIGSERLQPGSKLRGTRSSTGKSDHILVISDSRLSLLVGPAGDSDIAAIAYRPETIVELPEPVVEVLPMMLNGDALSDLVLMSAETGSVRVAATQPQSTFVVTSNLDSGPGSLRQAILDANAAPGADLITFSIATGGTRIGITSALPFVRESVTIDGTTQPGYQDRPLVEITGRFSLAQTGLHFEASNNALRGLIINAFSFALVSFPPGTSDNIVEGMFLGTDASGTVAVPPSDTGSLSAISINNSSRNRIGGTSARSGNLISGNRGEAIDLNGLAFDTVIQGNLIGTDVSGRERLQNGSFEIMVGAPRTIIGGTLPGARNVISGSQTYALYVRSTGALIQGNYIGTDAAGNKRFIQGLAGIKAESGMDITIGGTSPAAGNVLAANYFRSAMDISGNGMGSVVIQGNFVGVRSDGSAKLDGPESGSLAGIEIGSTRDALIGGVVPGARNVISGLTSDGHGILVYGGILGARQVEVLGNRIGTDVTGEKEIGNSGTGIFLSSGRQVTIGAPEPGAENIIAFNRRGGIYNEAGRRISIRANSIFSNNGLGVDLAPRGCSYFLGCAGITDSDPCDTDDGANELQNFPSLTSAVLDADNVLIAGTLDSVPGVTYQIDFYFTEDCARASRSGRLWFGSISLSLGASCSGSFSTSLARPVNRSGSIVATATAPDGSTSEFSDCIEVISLPQISSVSFVGKNLRVLGDNFDKACNVLMDGSSVKTKFSASEPQVLTAKKALKILQRGQTAVVQVRNSKGLVSNSISITRP